MITVVVAFLVVKYASELLDTFVVSVVH
jgi:hypothetical protein